MSNGNEIRTPDYDPENPRCDQEQLKFLKECIAEGDEGIKKWNQWRKKNEDTKIWLQHADFELPYLEGVGIVHAHLEEADLRFIHLEGAKLEEAHLKKANLWGVHLEGANLKITHLKEAHLLSAHMKGANLYGSNMEGAELYGAHMEGASLFQAHLEGANFQEADLRKANLSGSFLHGTNFRKAIVDGSTLIWDCRISKREIREKNYTDFAGVGLNSVRIQQQIKQLLEYNIRRMNWEAWYEYRDWGALIPTEKRERLSRIIHQPVKWFWTISDYGMSTGRIALTFMGFAFVFAIIYYIWGRLSWPGIIENLFVDRNGIDIQWWLVPLRTLYFSIVTQTTLGFGDMYANAHSICGHIFLSFQVILGYVLLGALVTRFAVLFTAGGPAGKFSN